MPSEPAACVEMQKTGLREMASCGGHRCWRGIAGPCCGFACALVVLLEMRVELPAEGEMAAGADVAPGGVLVDEETWSLERSASSQRAGHMSCS